MFILVPAKTRRKKAAVTNAILNFLQEKQTKELAIKNKKLLLEERRITLEERWLALDEKRFDLEKQKKRPPKINANPTTKTL